MSKTAGGRVRRRGAAAALAAAVAAACAVAAGGAGAGAARTAAPAPLRIVALGDSYTAGNGAGAYVVPDRGCHRSDAAYPGLLAGLLRARGIRAEALNVACSGAVVADVTQPAQARGGDPLAPQLAQVPDAVAAEAGLVVLTAGGNDLRFVDTVRCLIGLPPASGCAAVAAAADAALPGVAVATAATLRAVAARLPRAAIVLVGYPLLGSPPCAAGGAAWGRAVEARQVRVSRAQAAAVAAARRELPGRDIRFVATAAAFRGHGPCATEGAWVHGLLLAPAFAAFHPNPRGHAATARLLLPAALAAAAARGQG